MSRPTKTLLFVTILTLFAVYLNLPSPLNRTVSLFGRQFNIAFNRPPIKFNYGNFSFTRDMNLKKGLDIQGGLQITLEADMTSIAPEDRPTALESAKTVISRRVDMYGVTESLVTTASAADTYRIIVELPGVDNPQQALSLIGQTARLEFASVIYETATDSAQRRPVDLSPTDLTGADLKMAAVTFETGDRKPGVSLEFKSEGKEKFAKITKEHLNEIVAILLDGQIVTSPTVQSVITDGKAVITGNFTRQEAKNLSIQLNAGALPVPVNVISQKNIAPSLGQDSITKSITAGSIGLLMVILFMSFYYGWMGIIASFGLLLYGLITLTLYKLIPVTLTLPGIAGFLLSVGMAVDSNILVFERFKEEIRSGRSWKVALELGFGRAWDSIKDANTATIITALILFNPLGWNFLNTSGSVRGFALTLMLGIFISLFTGIIVTRNMLRLFYKGPRNSQLLSTTPPKP